MPLVFCCSARASSSLFSLRKAPRSTAIGRLIWLPLLLLLFPKDGRGKQEDTKDEEPAPLAQMDHEHCM